MEYASTLPIAVNCTGITFCITLVTTTGTDCFGGAAACCLAQPVAKIPAISKAPAVSVHAYSRPLTSMTFYDVDQRGALAPVLTLPTEDPEPKLELGSAR